MSSKLSPYRRNNYNQPLAQNYQNQKDEPSRLAQKSRMGKSRMSTAYTPDRKGMDGSYHFKVTQRKKNESQVKTQTLLQQNKYLLSENSQLSALVAERGQIILVLQQKLQRQMNQQVRTLQEIEFEKNRFIQQFHLKTREYDRRIQQLLQQIGNLHEQNYKIEISKESAVDDIKIHLSIEHKRQLEQLLDSYNKTKDFLELEIAKLKEINEHRENQIAQLQFQLRVSNEKARQEISSLHQQITHLKHMKKLEMSEKTVEFENQIQSLVREGRKEQQLTVITYEMQLKKIRNQLHAKRIEAQKLESQVQIGKIETQTKQNQLDEKRTQLEAQIIQLERKNKEIMFREKQNLKRINESQINVITATHQSTTQHLEAQINKLKTLNDSKSKQIESLHDQIEDLRNTKFQQIKSNQAVISELKEKILILRQDHQQDDENFKVKMAQLHHADISSLRQYYEDQMAVLQQDLQNREMIIKENRDKVHKEIQEKTELRKSFQIEVSKLKSALGELQLKVAAMNSQKRQQHANMSSKIQLTSMNLIRQTNEKEKNFKFYELQRKKLQDLTKAKDQQIHDLEDKIRQLKEDHTKQVQEKQEAIRLLDKKCQQLNISLKKNLVDYEKDISKRQHHHQCDTRFYQTEIQKLKRQYSEEYSRAVRELSQQKLILQHQKNELITYTNDLKSELAKIKEFRQEESINKQIDIERQRGILVSQRDLLEVSMRNFYQTQIQQKNQEIKDLIQQLKEKEQDIRQGAQKYHKLEKKLSALLESQQKLRDIQNKVMGLGQNNTAIKGLTEMLRSRRKA